MSIRSLKLAALLAALALAACSTPQGSSPRLSSPPPPHVPARFGAVFQNNTPLYATGLQGVTQSVDTLAQLEAQQAVNGAPNLATVAPTDGMVIVVNGGNAANDGAGGRFRYNATSTTAADGWTVAAVTGIATGRWFRETCDTSLGGVWSPVCWGAPTNGATGSLSAFQAAINAVPNGNSSANTSALIPVPAGTYGDNLASLSLGFRNITWQLTGPVTWSTAQPPGVILIQPMSAPASMVSGHGVCGGTNVQQPVDCGAPSTLSVGNVAALKALTTPGLLVTLLGYFNQGDLGPYPPPQYLLTASTVPCVISGGDGGSQISLNNGGCANYAKPITNLSGRFFGIQSQTETAANQSTKVQNFLNYVDTASGQSEVTLLPAVGPSSGSYITVSAPLTGPNMSNVTFKCGGAIVDARGITSGALFAPYTSWPFLTTQAQASTQHPFGPCAGIGPNQGSRSPNTVYMIAPVPNLYPPSSLEWNGGLRFQGIAATGFDALFVNNGGALGWTIDNAWYTSQTGVGGGTFLLMNGPSPTNDERINITNSFIVDVQDFIWDKTGSANDDIYLSGTSVDGTTRVITGGSSTPGTAGAQFHLFPTGWHVEQSGGLLIGCATQPFIWLAQTGAIAWNGGEFIVGPGPGVGCTAPISPVRVDAPASTGQGNLGFSLRDVLVNWATSPTTLPPTFFAGEGRVHVSGTSASARAYAALTGYSNNLIAGNEFATTGNNVGTGAGKWVASGGGTAVQSNAASPTNFTAQGTLANGSANVTGLTSGAAQVGLAMSGTGIPGGTTVSLTGIPGQVTMSANAASIGTQPSTITFTGGELVITSATSAGSTFSTYTAPACPAGSNIAFTAQVESSNVAATGSTTFLQVNFLDAAGNQLLPTTAVPAAGNNNNYVVWSSTSNIGTWTTEGEALNNIIVPPGAVQSQFIAGVTRGSTGSGAAVLDIGEVHANCQ